MGDRGSASRLRDCLEGAREAGSLALFCYITAGYPSLTATVEVADALVEAGGDCIELGIPFSDPLADGKVIQSAATAALTAGVGVSYCLEVAAAIRQRHPVLPLLFMGYYNPILQYGPGRFAAASADAGVDGLIVPDLPLEEAEELDGPCRDLGLAIVPLVAPVTTEARVRRIADRGATLLYVTSRMGVTGEGAGFAEEAPGLARRVREIAGLPVGVGFGISRAEHLAALRGSADATIVGSALLQSIASGREAADAAAAFVRGLLAG